MTEAEKNSWSEVSISIDYEGNNDNVFLTGLKIEDLQQAIIDFPRHCNGNIKNYILWPY